MLVDRYTLERIFKYIGLQCKGVLHVGAHYCEELEVYRYHLNVEYNKILWIEPQEVPVLDARKRHIENVFQLLISDKDDELVDFNIASNKESSSMLEFGKHTEYHPDVSYVEKMQMKTIRLDTFFALYNLDPREHDFWNIDVQGAEMLVLKGGVDAIKHANAIFIEVNKEELYKGCPLIQDIDDHLTSEGFTRIYTEIKEEYKWGDALYVRNKYVNFEQTLRTLFQSNKLLTDYTKTIEQTTFKDLVHIINETHKLSADNASNT